MHISICGFYSVDLSLHFFNLCIIFFMDLMICSVIFVCRGRRILLRLAQRSQITCDKLGMFVSPKSSVRMVDF
ncbi:hypothetical protein I3842_05G074800 [Carya illinoinensis]|uniref:Uncharacterized protein n=1 Tax=Carya illinoinensis TaxID=32201 RepID=A0A922AA12_CARIL|nr:hypothetical protein I3842_14G044800 [Carya illinoinensis]KAG6711839.1 hypothetical protein I3842_05G074800 [Carya illinoinensis]